MTRPWKQFRIGSYLIASNAISLTLILILFSAGVTLLFWRNLEQGLHRELGREFEVMESLMDSSGSVRLRFDDAHDEAEAAYEGEAIAAEVWSSPSKRLGRTKAAQHLGLPNAHRSPPWGASGFGELDTEGDTLHVLQGLHAVNGQTFLIRVFRSDKPIRKTVSTLIWTLAVGFVLAIALAVMTSFRLVRTLFLKPLAQMAEAAHRISTERTGASVLPIANPNDELGHLGQVFNDVLKRYDLAVSRARRFSADASHELRTPLTSIRSVGEVALQTPQTPEAYQDTLGSILEDIDGITALLDSLMLLSKADEGKVPLSREDVNLHQFLETLIEDMTALSEAKEQTLTLQGEQELDLALDLSVLRLALVNLIDNAIKFAPDGSDIQIDLRRASECVQIDVHNAGDGIPAEHRELIFDRFCRVDTGRSRSAGGTGLGLSVARWAVEAHGGTLNVVNTEQPGATFRIELPLRPAGTE